MNADKAKELLEKAVRTLTRDNYYDLHTENNSNDDCPICLITQALAALSVCPECGGSGFVPENQGHNTVVDIPCPSCQHKPEPLKHNKDCPACKGVTWKICPVCNPEIAELHRLNEEKQKLIAENAALKEQVAVLGKATCPKCGQVFATALL
jgi:RecJ-like exonuclease